MPRPDDHYDDLRYLPPHLRPIAYLVRRPLLVVAFTCVFAGLNLILVPARIAEMLHILPDAVHLIGVSLAAVGAVFIAFNFYRDALRSVQAQLDSMDRDRFGQLMERIAHLSQPTRTEIETAYENQSKAILDFPSLAKSAKERIDLLGTTLIGFHWTPDVHVATRDAMKRGVTIRLLLLSPNSSYLAAFAEHEHLAVESLQSELVLSIDKWQYLIRAPSTSSTKCEVRTYQSFPTAFVMLVDDTALYSPYLQSSSSMSAMPCFRFRGGGIAYQAVRSHFEALWMAGRPLSEHENHAPSQPPRRLR